jgi:Fe-Mn family superoxide dismutase
MAFTQPPLPYALGDLAPYLSEEQMSFHYGKHHAAYFTNLNNLIAGTANEGKSLEDLVTTGTGGVFNNAAQAWNHTFFWQSMTPGGGGQPTGAIAAAIVRDFGSFEALKEQFNKAAVTMFGSGWAWLQVDDSGKLSVWQADGPAGVPMRHGQRAVLTVDVWEHAYYIDYRNERPKFVAAFLDDLVNWEWAARNFDVEPAKRAEMASS